MKSIYNISMLCIVSIILSCSKSSSSSGTGSHACSFSTPAYSAPANGSVKYEVKLTGTGQVTQIVFKTQTGDSTIHSPGLPFQITLPINTGNAIGISATGNTSGGTIDIQYSFSPTGGGFFTNDENSCGN